MAFTDEDRNRIQPDIEAFLARRRPPPDIRDEVDLIVRIVGQALEVLEIRPAWNGAPGETTELPIAKIRYVRRHDHWRLYWMRRDLRWHAYDPHPVASTSSEALGVVASDAYACFFG
ncbi:MAG: DUF3024 domain-containing protein [Trueperaceae bacterium]